MIKKITIILFVGILLSSCGKKSDPIYNEENQNSKVFSLQQNIISWSIKKINLTLMVSI